MVGSHVGEFVSLCFMAVALGMDSFSVSLGMGMQELRLKRIAIIGITFGLFHMIMPFIGMSLGKIISIQFGHFAIIAGGLLLIAIGIQMIFTGFNYNVKTGINPVGIGLLLLAFIISLDAFSVGLSLGMSGVKTAIALLLFGCSSTVLTWTGMLLGRRVHGLLGVYSEILGGSILCSFGMYFIFG